MILAIDIGNTNIVLGYMDGKKILGTSRTVTMKEADAAQYEKVFAEKLAESGMRAEDFEGAILSSVVPEIDDSVAQTVLRLTGKRCIRVTPGMRTDMAVKIDEPETLAGDLIVGSVGAMKKYPLPVAVIDMGTATTIVVVDGDGAYRGGAIIPGMKLSLSALTAGTSLLPGMAIGEPAACIATNTVDSMRSGAIYGTAAMLDGMVQRMEEELGEPVNVVATGGLAGCVLPYCRRKIVYDPDLVLHGMAALYEMNKGQEGA